MLQEILNAVDMEFEASITDIPPKLAEFEDKTLLFNLHPKSGLKSRVLGNLCANRDKIDELFGLNIQSLLNAIENPQNPRIKSDGAVKDHITEPNLNELPISKYYPKDGGRYITSGVVVTNDPEYGRNMSFHRMMVLKKDELAIRLVPRDTYTYYERAMQRGENLEIAIAIGLHPAVLLAASSSVPIQEDELKIATSLLGGLNLIKCETVNLEVPDAEIILEGYITKKTTREGPFVDITRTYDYVREQPVVKLTQMMHRTNAIYHSILPGGKEHRILMGMPREALIYGRIGKHVRDVCLTPGGSGWLHAVISIHKTTEEDPKKDIMAAFEAHPSLKHVVIVDSDINIHNPEEVEWAIATRFQAEKDLILIKGAKGSSLDPSAGELTSKLGLDATRPLNKEGFDMVRV